MRPKRLLGHNSPGGLVIDVEVSSRESQGIGCSFDVLSFDAKIDPVNAYGEPLSQVSKISLKFPSS